MVWRATHRTDDRKPIVGPIHGDRTRSSAPGLLKGSIGHLMQQALARALLQQEAIPDVLRYVALVRNSRSL